MDLNFENKVADALCECIKYAERRLLSPEMDGRVQSVDQAIDLITKVITKKFEALGPDVPYLISDDVCEAYKMYFMQECDNILSLYFEHINKEG